MIFLAAHAYYIFRQWNYKQRRLMSRMRFMAQNVLESSALFSNGGKTREGVCEFCRCFLHWLFPVCFHGHDAECIKIQQFSLITGHYSSPLLLILIYFKWKHRESFNLNKATSQKVPWSMAEFTTSWVNVFHPDSVFSFVKEICNARTSAVDK